MFMVLRVFYERLARILKIYFMSETVVICYNVKVVWCEVCIYEQDIAISYIWLIIPVLLYRIVG